VALGECALRLHDQALAETRFGQAVTASRTPQSTSVDIGQVYYDLGQRTQAIAYYERAMQQGTPDPLLQNNLAWTYAEEGIQLDRALELSLQAVKSEADNVVYLDTYAEVLHLSGRHVRALAVIRRACALEPEGGENYQYLQEQLEKLGRAAAAIAQRR
jgi:tetratricopeptide (TPR) repeat protein